MTNFFPIPQPEYNLSFLNINDLEIVKQGRLNLVGNPELIQINEILIGITNYEMLAEILSNCVKENKNSMMDLIFDSYLKQRSFFPILPNLPKEFDFSTEENVISTNYSEVNIPLEIKQLNKTHFEYIPDIIITPFKNVPFAKKSKDTVFINPLKVINCNYNSNTSNKEIGSYVSLYVFPPSKSGTKVHERLLVDKVSISEV